MEIRVNAGYAFINGYAFRNPATLSVTLDTAEGALNRVDRVVVRWDLPQRDMYIAVLKGTPSAKPTATAVTRTTEIWELALADIYVGKGVTRIQTTFCMDTGTPPEMQPRGYGIFRRRHMGRYLP